MPDASETHRLSVLNGYDILDTPTEEGFDDIVRMASEVCETPVALVSFVSFDRQWFKARVGFDACETPLGQSVCQYVVAERRLIVIPDLTQDERSRFNTLVTGPPFIRFYAGAPLHAPSGEVLGALCVIDHKARPEGLTERQSATLSALGRQVMIQLELRRLLIETAAREEQLAQLQSTTQNKHDRLWRMPDLLLGIAGFDTVIHAVNPAWMTLLGWSETDLIGQSYTEFIHPDDVAGSLDWASRYMAGQKVEDLENRYLCKNGGLRWIGWTVTVGDQVLHCAGRDITALKAHERNLAAAEDALRQSQKMEAVGQLTGGIAHDFNNLLTGITGSLDRIQLRIAQGRYDEISRYSHAAQGAAQRAAALTHRLLAFSRRQTLDPKAVNVNRLIADMEDLIRRTAGPAISIEVVGAGGLWATLIDHNQLENALLNLCINARDAMPGGGLITIKTANTWLDDQAAKERDLTPGPYICLCVTDTGTGMTPDTISRAFDPFFTTKPLGMGTGLGLSMIYGFARQSGGQVQIDSEVGRGTTMRLYLPRFMGDHENGEAIALTLEAAEAKAGETVLIVDDEPVVRMLIRESLDEAGFVTLEAEDGMAGLRTLQTSSRIDLLITDVGLPGGLNGRQMADAARATRPDLKVLFITGYAENAVVGNGQLEHGMSILTKPFTMDALGAKVRELMRGE